MLTPKLERMVAERIRMEIEPLREAGKLGAFLLQLSPSFSPRKTSSMSSTNSAHCFTTIALRLSCGIATGFRRPIVRKP